MNTTLQFCYLNKDRAQAEIVRDLFIKNGFSAELIDGEPNKEGITAILLTSGMTLDELFHDLPWIKRELSRSTSSFRATPMVIYDSQKESRDEAFENGIEEVYEEVFSEEFKPFAVDIADRENTIAEFQGQIDKYFLQ